MLWALIERQQKVICQFDDDESAQREMLWSIVEHQQRKISALGGDALQSTKLLLEVCAKHQANPRKRARIASPPRSSRNTKAHQNFATPSPSKRPRSRPSSRSTNRVRRMSRRVTEQFMEVDVESQEWNE